MSVSVSHDRKAVELTWDSKLVVGDTADIRCVNPDDGDVSTRTADNDGRATVTFPKDYSGSCEVTVTGSDSGEDSGTISV